MDNSISLDTKNRYWWIAYYFLLTLIRWIAIYPVDSAIQPSDNRGLVGKLITIGDLSLSIAKIIFPRKVIESSKQVNLIFDRTV